MTINQKEHAKSVLFLIGTSERLVWPKLKLTKYKINVIISTTGYMVEKSLTKMTIKMTRFVESPIKIKFIT